MDLEACKGTDVSQHSVVNIGSPDVTRLPKNQIRSAVRLPQTSLCRGDEIQAVPRLPAEFRTLSLRVDTKPSGDDEQIDKSRKAVTRELHMLDWHKISVDEVLQRLNVSPKTGLDTTQAQRRLQAAGKNIISPPPKKWLRKILGWLLGGFGSLLLAASIVCFIAWKPLGNPDPQASNLALAIVLLVVLVLQAVFNAWQDFSASKVMSSIKDLLPTDVLIIRDGMQTNIDAEQLVTGDLVLVSLGEKVPADLRMIEVSDLRFDRSILTGESEPVSGRIEKTDDNFLETKNIALQGTHCVNGSGVGVVIQTGDNTVFGRIANLSSHEPTRLTTLQREILHFVFIIAGLATAVAILIIILWAAWLRQSHPSYIDVSGLLIDVVSVMVAFIPEGLPVAVTLSLAKVAHTLSKHKVLCKSLSIVETLGCVNILCSDKTGTLTQNRMHVENAAVFDYIIDNEKLNLLASGGKDAPAISLSQVAAVGYLCNATKIVPGTGTSAEKHEPELVGDATDVAILRFSQKVGAAEALRQQWIDVFQQSFNSKTKFMLKLSKLYPTMSLDTAPLASWDEFARTDYLMTVKGAPEILLPRCSHVLDPSHGHPVALTEEAIQRLTTVQEDWAKEGQRVILLARRIIRKDMIPGDLDPSADEFAEEVDSLNSNLIIVGLLGLMDPLKPTIRHTVSVCRRAGIRFFVVTGDHPTTATAIARNAGIITARDMHSVSDLKEVQPALSSRPEDDELSNQSIVVTGAQLDTLNQAQMEQLCQYEEIVFARTTPEQKLRIVHEFKGRENVVAMTGDGVNDAPSLKAADCGIAVGDGSDVAKEAADMILLDDFSAIVIALEYGRLVYDNLRKTILYLLPAGSFSELMPILLNVLLGLPQMLSNIQMILICVATDVLPALSMCLEAPEDGLLDRKPRNVKTERLADWRLMFQAYAFLGVLESLCAMSMSFWYLQRKGVPFSSLVLGFGNWPGLDDELLFTAQSVYFFTLILMQLGNLLSTRGRKLSIFQHTPASNWYVIPAAGISLCLGFFFCYVPWFQHVFQMRGVPVEFFFIPISFALGLLFLDECRKYCVRRYPSSVVARLAW
ncbi:sodium-potassium ATPase [Obba rivulosa]|uniref:Sodium-potassium ATPase n=1 Tax=Obba rivulosa TaxID=1052685 RepID=A0A8E2J7H7_9APHY|nr:sodium-potassium ATPase [Obba rivulosa]